jgi:hypothetical protein
MSPHTPNRAPRGPEQQPVQTELLKIEPSSLHEVQAQMTGMVAAQEREIAKLTKESSAFSPRTRYELEQAAERQKKGLRELVAGHRSAAKIAAGDFSRDDWAIVATAFIESNSHNGVLDIDHLTEFEFNGVRFRGAALEQLKRTSKGIAARAEIMGRTQTRSIDQQTGEEKVEGGVQYTSLRDIADITLASKRGGRLQEALEEMEKMSLPMSMQRYIGEAFENGYSSDPEEMRLLSEKIKAEAKRFIKRGPDNQYSDAQKVALRKIEQYVDKTHWELRAGASHLEATAPDLMRDLAAAYRKAQSPEEYEARKYSLINLYMAKTFNLNVGAGEDIQNPRVTRTMIEKEISRRQQAWFKERSAITFKDISTSTRNVPFEQLPDVLDRAYRIALTDAVNDGILLDELNYDPADATSKVQAERKWIQDHLSPTYPEHIAQEVRDEATSLLIYFGKMHEANASLEQNIARLRRYYMLRYNHAPSDAVIMEALRGVTTQYHLENLFENNRTLFGPLMRPYRGNNTRVGHLRETLENIHAQAFNGEYPEFTVSPLEFAEFAYEYFHDKREGLTELPARRAYYNMAETYGEYIVYLKEQERLAAARARAANRQQQGNRGSGGRRQRQQPPQQQAVATIAP